MKGWLDKYNDGGPVQENYNDYSVSAPDGYVGVGTFNEGRNYSPAWGGQFQMGGAIGGATQGIPGATGFMYARTGTTPSNGKYAKKTKASAQNGGNLSFINDPKLRNMLEGYKPGFMDTVGDYRLPEGYMAGSIDPSTEVSMSIGVAPSYLIPSFKYGQPLQDPVQEFNMTGQNLGGPFKTVEDAETFRELRHQYVEKGQPLPSPIATANMTIDPDLVERGQYRSSKAIEKVDPNNTYDPLDAAVFFYLNNRAKITKKDVEGVKTNMINYVNSPLYRQRLNNYPENYRGDEGSYQKKKFENAIANAKVKERAKQLRTVPYDIKDDGVHGNLFNQYSNKVNLLPINSLPTIAHELGHAGTRQAMPSMKDVPAESDYSSGRYWDSITNKTKLNPFSIGLNEKEIEELVDRAKPLAKDTLYEGDPHDDKNTMSIDFAQESYGDLMGAREILYKKGYTKNFGDPIDKKLLDKVMKDKSISEDFIFRRFYEKYGADNVIHLNNTIASNDVKQGIPMAQNGKEVLKEIPKVTTTKLLPPTIGPEEELTKPEPTELEPEKEIPYVPSPEPEYIEPVEPPETKSEPYVSTTPTNRERERERERKLDLVELYSNPESDYDVQEYMKSFFAVNKNKIDAKTVNLAKRDIAQYINSPQYAQRQANFPEKYIGGSADYYAKKQFDAAIAKAKRQERLKNLNTVPVTLTDDKHSNFFVPDENRISLNKNNIPSVLYHELTHASSRDIDFEPIDPRQLRMDQMFGVGRTFPESDRVNTRYWDSIVSKTGKKPVSAGLNISEQNKFVELAKPADYRPDDIHYSNTTDAQEFSSEQYGDLMGVRSLLYKSGITKSFGEKLDKAKLDKALNNSKVKADPVFKRFFFRYGPENVIQLNNTIAANNPQQGMPMAQNGGKMSYYQNGLDFEPKGMGENGYVIKDDMGQWAHPGEITEIGSNQITMQGVPYPVLGVSDMGDTQMMYPDEEYEFIGDSVTEYPMMKQGGQLTKLDQLLNFTNYNTKQPGGWLDKYQ
jgi:hypothetical protein